jgi:hypothetical protein
MPHISTAMRTVSKGSAKLAFDPGAACGYSTHALHHAALVCETVTGKPYDLKGICAAPAGRCCLRNDGPISKGGRASKRNRSSNCPTIPPDGG